LPTCRPQRCWRQRPRPHGRRREPQLVPRSTIPSLPPRRRAQLFRFAVVCRRTAGNLFAGGRTIVEVVCHSLRDRDLFGQRSARHNSTVGCPQPCQLRVGSCQRNTHQFRRLQKLRTYEFGSRGADPTVKGCDICEQRNVGLVHFLGAYATRRKLGGGVETMSVDVDQVVSESAGVECRELQDPREPAFDGRVGCRPNLFFDSSCSTRDSALIRDRLDP